MCDKHIIYSIVVSFQGLGQLMCGAYKITHTQGKLTTVYRPAGRNQLVETTTDSCCSRRST